MRVGLGEECNRPAKQALRRMHVAAREGAPARGREPARRVATDRAVLVQRPQLAQVAMRLLEVVAEDLLELERAVAVGVDAIGPAHEVDVQAARGRA